jgi:hypothetical protein
VEGVASQTGGRSTRAHPEFLPTFAKTQRWGRISETRQQPPRSAETSRQPLAWSRAESAGARRATSSRVLLHS